MHNVEEFQTVSRRKCGKKLRNKHFRKVSHYLDFEENITTDDLIRSVLAAVVDFRKSPFNQTIFNGLSKSLNILNSNTIAEVVCYGLGSFSQNRSSKYQLSSLLTIKNRYACEVLLYDPIFTKTEIEVLKTLELKVIEKNDEGKHVISNNRLTLVFMPHCPSQLLNNFLYCNWGTQLKNCILLCNSWSQLYDQNPLGSVKNETNYISRIYPHVIENKLENNFEYIEAFSSTSVHIFSQFNETPIDFWHPTEEPIYLTENSEFIAKNSSSST